MPRSGTAVIVWPGRVNRTVRTKEIRTPKVKITDRSVNFPSRRSQDERQRLRNPGAKKRGGGPLRPGLGITNRGVLRVAYSSPRLAPGANALRTGSESESISQRELNPPGWQREKVLSEITVPHEFDLVLEISVVKEIGDIGAKLSLVRVPYADSPGERQRCEIDARRREHVAAKRTWSGPGIFECGRVEEKVAGDRPAANIKRVDFARIQPSVGSYQVGPVFLEVLVPGSAPEDLERKA